MFTASLDQEFDGGGNLHDIIGEPTQQGGQKPQPMKTSWHMRERVPPPDRKPVTIFFIDRRGGDTIATAKTIEQAMECIREIGDPTLVLRPYVVTEESLRADEEYSRQERQLGR